MSANIPKEVVVVGGSLGGLFAGIVFTRLGCNVSILERTPEEILVDQGAGISVAPIYPPIIKALMEGGLPSAPIVEFFAKYDRTGTPYMDLKGDGLRYFKRDGTVKTDIKVPLLLASCSWSLLYNMLRANFDGKYEAGYVKSPKVEFGDGRATYYSGVRVIGIHDIGGEKVQVEYRGDDGKTKSLDANMVIGADGQNSFLQQLFQPEVERKYAGYVAWRGTTVKKDLSAETRSLLDKLAAFYLTKGNQVLQYVERKYPHMVDSNILTFIATKYQV
jgi:2-polyprenyl-6-methoxyphenol hydroxylase-like FAD-dependent oxidoreductase